MKDFFARWMPIDASTHGAEYAYRELTTVARISRLLTAG